MNITKEIFGQTQDEIPVFLYTLSNKNNLKIKLTNFGAILVSLEAPDKHGNFSDVVLGYDTLQGYIEDQSAFGACIGRYANRIANAEFELNGKKYGLEKNLGRHHLHGGSAGFQKQVFEAKEFENPDGAGIRFKYHSNDGEGGYPGNVEVEFVYTLTDSNSLDLEFIASTDQDTPINLTHHSYFNLKGAGNSDILGHELEIYADRYIVTDGDLIPTGQIAPVEGKMLDFTAARTIGAFRNEHPELYDNTFVLQGPPKKLKKGLRLCDQESGRVLELFTTQPGLHVYSANFFENIKGKSSKVYNKYTGLALEPQHFPNSVNIPEFPDTILKPGDKFYQKSEFRFSVKE